MIIASRDFRDEEYFVPYEIFQKAGAEITTASSKTGMILGVMGGEAEATLNIKNVKTEDFDVVIFVGGDGAQEYFENKEAHRIAQEFYNAKKTVGAICIAPVILAKAGILKDKTATVWSSTLDKTGPKALTQGGCAVSQNTIEKSDNIITGRDREASEEFARKIVVELNKV